MANWILTAKQSVSSPIRGRSDACVEPKNLEKGYTLTVATQSTGSPNHGDVIGALILAGFCKEEAEAYNGSSWSNHFEGRECGETDFTQAEKQHKAQYNRDAYSAFKKSNNGNVGDASTTQNGSSTGNRGGGILGGILSVISGISSPSNNQQSNSTKKFEGLFGGNKKAEPAKKFGGLFGDETKVKPARQSGGLFGGEKKAEPARQSGGLFGGEKKAEPAKKSGGLFGGDKKAEPAKKSGGLLGGGGGGSASKSRGMGPALGGKKKR